jgi:hypothetical protein
MATTDFVVKNGLTVTEKTTVNIATDATSSTDTSASINTAGGAAIAKKLYVGTALAVGTDTTLTGDLAVNGGDITSTATTFNLLNATVTTGNLFGAGTSIAVGATTGTLTLNNPTVVGSQTTQNVFNATATTVNAFGAGTTIGVGATTGTLTLNNPTVVGTQTTVNLWNTTSTSVNAFGAGTSISVGANSGTFTHGNPTVVGTQTTVNLWNTTSTTVNFAGAATSLVMGSATLATATLNPGTLVGANTTQNVFNTVATTVNAFGAGTTIGVGATTGTLTLNNPTVVGSQTTVNLWNTTSTTVNAFGAGTTIGVGATTGTLTLNNPTVVGSQVTVNLWNTTSTTVNAFGAATAIGIGATTGTTTLNNPTVVGSQTTVNLWNATSTTVNAFGAATAINMGANSGTITIGNPTIVGTQTTQNVYNTTATTVNAFGAATSLNVGASSGTMTIGNATITGTNATTVNINGASPTIASTSTGTLTLFNTNLTTVNAFNAATTATEYGAVTSLAIGNTATAAQTVNMFTASTGASTYNFATGATANATTKTINVGTGAAAGSTTNVNIGSIIGGAVTANRLVAYNGAFTAGTSSSYAANFYNSSGTSNDVSIGSDASYGYLQTWNSKPLYINNQGNNIYTGSGLVAIGTSTISLSKFVVNGGSVNTTTYTSSEARISDGSIHLMKTVAGGIFEAVRAINNDTTAGTTVRVLGAATSDPFNNANGGKVFIDAIRTSTNMDLAFSLNDASGVAPIERVRMMGSGNVGFGTSAPYGKLDARVAGSLTQTDISGTANNGAFVVSIPTYATGTYVPLVTARMNDNNPTVANAGIYTQFTNSGSNIYIGGSGNYATGINTTNNLFIRYDGNVGIGLGTATVRLDIANGARTGSSTLSSSAVYVTGTTSDADTTVIAQWRHGNQSQGIGISYNTIRQVGSNTNQSIRLASKGTGNTELAYNSGDANLGTVALTVQGTDGKVGIGTTTPSYNLHVYNDADVWHTAFGGASGTLRIGGQTSSGAVVQAYTPAGVVRDLYLQRDGGNVGIFTNSPSAKLHVVGTESRFGGVASGYISVYNASSRSGYIQANGGTDFRIATDSDPLTFYFSSSEKARIDTNTFYVNYNASYSSGTVKAMIANGSNGLPATSGSTQTYGALRLRGGDNAVLDFGLNSTFAWIQATDQANLTNTYDLGLNPNGGNITIGNTSGLGYKLGVNGQAGISYQASFNTTTPGLTRYGLHFQGQTTADYATGITWNGGTGTTSAQAGIYVQGSGSYGTKMYFATTNSYATGAITALTIDHNGYVAIGAGLAPSTNARLDITSPTPATINALRVKSNLAWLSPSATKTITSKMLDTGTLSFEGTAGQLFSVSDSFTGTIFSVNDVSGIPSIEVLDTGVIKMGQYGGFVAWGVSDALTAAGSTQATALALTRPINNITTTAASTGVILPTATPGMRIMIRNGGANTLNVYPASGAQINSVGTNTAFGMGTGVFIEFVAMNTTQWYTLTATYS